MNLLMPDDQTLYDALLARDAAYEGRIWVTVASTGVFCRLTCPARKPKRENCAFHDSLAACIAGGFRPCKRCNPLAQTDPAVTDLLAALEATPDHRWTAADVAARGYDAATIRRAFQRQFGMTFLEVARQRRLATGFTTLVSGARVIDAQIDAGFESAQAFRDAFARQIGLNPGAFRRNARIRVDQISTPLGTMVAATDATHLHLLEFFDRKALPAEMARLYKLIRGDIGFGRTGVTDQTETQLAAYFAGRDARFTVPLALHGTPFTRSVWQALQDVPAGETRSYAALAAGMGRPTATRAVARANGANQIAILIPCHRILGADGSLTGYGGGLWRKDRLIATEHQYKGRHHELS